MLTEQLRHCALAHHYTQMLGHRLKATMSHDIKDAHTHTDNILQGLGMNDVYQKHNLQTSSDLGACPSI